MDTRTCDDKIMAYDLNDGYETFVSMFTDDELQAMRHWLYKECGYDDEEVLANREEVIAIYVKEWLIYDIRESWIDNCTDKLYEIVEAFYNNK